MFSPQNYQCHYYQGDFRAGMSPLVRTDSLHRLQNLNTEAWHSVLWPFPFQVFLLPHTAPCRCQVSQPPALCSTCQPMEIYLPLKPKSYTGRKAWLELFIVCLSQFPPDRRINGTLSFFLIKFKLQMMYANVFFDVRLQIPLWRTLAISPEISHGAQHLNLHVDRKHTPFHPIYTE